MKKIFTYAMLMMSMCLFTACPSDDDDDENKVKASSTPFAGYWKIKRGEGTTNMFFYDNGKLLHMGKEYIWNYDKNTRLLATTDDVYQWEVTLTDSIAWSGIALWGSKSSVTNYRATAEETAWQILSTREWVYNDTIWKFSSNDDGRDYTALFHSKGASDWSAYYHKHYCTYNVYSVKESLANGVINVNASLSDKLYSVVISGILNIKINNPYSYDNVRVTCRMTYKTTQKGEVTQNLSKDMVLKPRR